MHRPDVGSYVDLSSLFSNSKTFADQLSEALYEDREFSERQLASLVLAKVYYHLQEYDDSMIFALGAGDLFRFENDGEFEETIISKCIDTYIALSASQNTAPYSSLKDTPHITLATSFASTVNEANVTASLTSPTTPFSHSTVPSKSLLSRESTTGPTNSTSDHVKDKSIPALDNASKAALQRIIERLFENCLREGRYKQVVGIAIEAQNLSVLRQVIKRVSENEGTSKSRLPEETPGPTEELMDYILSICMDIVQERGLRTRTLKLILDLLNEIPSPDYFSIAKCAVYLDQDKEASTLLTKLVVCISVQSLVYLIHYI